MVLDVAGQRCMDWDGTFGYDAGYYGTNFIDATDGTLTRKQEEGDWIKDGNGNRLNRTRLKKMCPQKIADGTFNTLKVSYSYPVHNYQSDGSTDISWLVRDIEGKEGQLTLEVFGNADTDFALQKTVTLPGEPYVMPAFDGFKENGTRWPEDLRLNEFFMKRLNLMAADFNNDGVDDIVVGFCEKWLVIDGKDYTSVLAQRTFPTDCVRGCVGDLDADGFADIGVIYQKDKKYYVYVMLNDISKFDGTKNPDLDEASDHYAELTVDRPNISSLMDIKFGDIDNTGNAVLCLTMPIAHIQDNAPSTFNVLARGDKAKLIEKYTFTEYPITELTSFDHDRSSTNTNSTIAVVHTRGMGSRPDVLLRNGLYRLNDANEFEQVVIGTERDGGKRIDVVIPSDCVGVGRFTDDLPDGYEQLAIFGERVCRFYSSDWSSSAGDWHRRSIDGLTELFTPVPSKGEMSRKVLHVGVIASVCNWTKDGDYHFGASLPAFCATSYTNIDTRRFKFVSCQATMSEPRIKFMLAAAPYYEGYDYSNGPSTSWAQSSSQSYTEGYSNGTKASVIFGYEQENKVSLFGIEIGKYGFEFETEISHEWEKSVSNTNTYTFESGCDTGDDDVVGLSMTPVWLYTYECIDSNNPDNIGEKLVCGAPSYPRNLEITLTDYMKLRGDREDIPDLSTVFTHTPGKPFTYANNPDSL